MHEKFVSSVQQKMKGKQFFERCMTLLKGKNQLSHRDLMQLFN